LDSLLIENPYTGFPKADHPTDFQGWGFNHPVFGLAIRTLRPQVIIEVGTWKGGSALAMAAALKENDIKGAIICVDTWLGSPEHLNDPKRNRTTPSLRYQWGYPRLYHTFMANVLSRGHEDTIIPYPSTSENAAKVFRTHKIKADLIYTDAAHEEEPVYNDLRNY
jgi:hypothetical protein